MSKPLLNRPTLKLLCAIAVVRSQPVRMGAAAAATAIGV